MSFSHEEIIPVKHLLKIHPRHLKDHKIQTQHSKDKKRKKKISTESYHKTSTLKHNKKKKKRFLRNNSAKPRPYNHPYP